MTLNMNDPFEAHAYFALLFLCDRCGRELEHKSNHKIGSDAYCREFASAARVQNWYCPPPDRQGLMHVMFCLCNECVPFIEEELARTAWDKLP